MEDGNSTETICQTELLALILSYGGILLIVKGISVIEYNDTYTLNNSQLEANPHGSSLPT